MKSVYTILKFHDPGIQNERQIITDGKTKAGKQRYKCQNMDCPRYSFQRDLIYKGCFPEIKAQIVDMARNIGRYFRNRSHKNQ